MKLSELLDEIAAVHGQGDVTAKEENAQISALTNAMYEALGLGVAASLVSARAASPSIVLSAWASAFVGILITVGANVAGRSIEGEGRVKIANALMNTLQQGLNGDITPEYLGATLSKENLTNTNR
jgi:hypothetical protein